MDEPIFLGDWLPPDPPPDRENWILRVDESDDYPPYPDQTALMLAIEANDLQTVQVLLACGLSPNLRDAGMPMLSIACFRGATEIVKALLEAGADPNLEYYDGETSLIFAARSEHHTATKIVRALLKAGADPKHQDQNCYTPLRYASGSGHYEMTKDLLQAGANARDALYGVSSTSDGDKRKIFEHFLNLVSDEDLLHCLSENDLKSILGFEFDEQPYED